MAETQRTVKQDGPSTLDEILRLRTNREKLTTWRRDIVEVLQAFDVRSISSAAHSQLSSPFQTESAISPYLMVADIDQNVLEEQKYASDKNRSVGATCDQRQNAYHRLDSNQVSGIEHCRVSSLTFLQQASW